uniref:Uncharacterized protein n=2 Tax=Hucho hucho TaxID=62062 RepID=A0A4W5LUM7_9TELE
MDVATKDSSFNITILVSLSLSPFSPHSAPPPPSLPFCLQFALWVDAVIFVFSLEDEISFQTVYHYYSRMANYRNTAEVPLVLVGTQDAISSANPRVIDDTRARKLSNDLKRCTYYETCATYGLNVERVFQDGM